MHRLEDEDELINLDTDENPDFPDMPYDPFEHRISSDDEVPASASETDAAPSEDSLSQASDKDDSLSIEDFVKKPSSGGTDKKNISRRKYGRSRLKGRRRTGSVLTWVLAFTTICSMGLCIYMLIHPRTAPVSSDDIVDAEAPVMFSQEEVDLMMAQAAQEREQEIKAGIQDQLEMSDSNFSDTLRWLYPEAVLYQDAGSYHFIPISETIERNNLSQGNFSVSENGEITYTEQGVSRALKGIDVSQHQGEIDWEQVASSGVDFAIIRAGIRGYESGALVTDQYFEANMQGALNHNIEAGVYFFTQAVTVEEALEEAQYVLELVAPYQITYPIVIDVENPSPNARANALTQEERTTIVSAFCDAIEAAGYTPMIYGGTYSLFGMMDIERIQQYKIWHAFYNDYVYYPYRLQMWQYTNSASVPGIEGNVDMNLWFLE